MNDPISSCLKQNDYKQTAVELFLDYILSQKRSFFIHKMILANLKDISECDKLLNFEKFLEDMNDNDEFDTATTKFGWLLENGEHSLESHAGEEMKIRKFNRSDYAVWILKEFKPNSIERNLADIPSECFDSVMSGQMPVKHFFLDMRPIFYH